MKNAMVQRPWMNRVIDLVNVPAEKMTDHIPLHKLLKAFLKNGEVRRCNVRMPGRYSYPMINTQIFYFVILTGVEKSGMAP